MSNVKSVSNSRWYCNCVCQDTWRVFQIPGDTVIVCVKICNSVSVWIMHSTVFCDANLLPVILKSPQSLMPVCCQSSYRVHNLWCQLVACHPTESTIFDGSLLPVILQSPQSLMPACCQSSYRVHNHWCQLVASHHTESTIFDGSLLQVSIHSTNCCQSSHSVHNLLWCQLVASHGTESTVCLLYCSLNFMYYYFTIPPWLPKNCPLWDD